MKSFVGILWLVALFGCVLGQINVDGPCRTLPVVSNFDPESYVGVWYQLKRYDTVAENGLDCNTADYSLNAGGVDVINSGTDLTTEYHAVVEGRAYVSFPEEVPLRGLLNVTFYGPADHVNYRVIETDYENYSLVWDCVNRDDGTANEYAWILARSYQVTGNQQDRVDELVAQYLDASKLVVAVQDQSLCLGGEIEPAVVPY